MMRDIIERVKSQNGGENISQKDLTWYLIGRVDDIHDKFTPKSLFWKISSGLFALLGGLAYYTFFH